MFDGLARGYAGERVDGVDDRVSVEGLVGVPGLVDPPAFDQGIQRSGGGFREMGRQCVDRALFGRADQVLHPGAVGAVGIQLAVLVTESYLQVLEHSVPKSQWPVDPTTFGQPS